LEELVILLQLVLLKVIMVEQEKIVQVVEHTLVVEEVEQQQ
tara:strand:- start:143 stop:265 length:123 start_codon:yes stop_codon:yes gene_type:complete